MEKKESFVIYAHRVRAAGACQRFGGALGYRNSFEIVWEN